jgi:uncharacterized protein YjaG (DUF416 family)
MEKILKSLEKLNNQQLLAFSYLCSSYMIDNYKVFTKKYNWGNVLVLINALDTIENVLFNKRDEIYDLTKLIILVDKEIPNTSNFSTILCSFALDSSNCILETLNFIKTHEVEYAKNIAIFCRDTVDMYIQEINDMDYNNPKFEEEISKHELMISELERQGEIIKKLKTEKEFNQDIMTKFENINKKTNRPNLNLLL